MNMKQELRYKHLGASTFQRNRGEKCLKRSSDRGDSRGPSPAAALFPLRSLSPPPPPPPPFQARLSPTRLPKRTREVYTPAVIHCRERNKHCSRCRHTYDAENGSQTAFGRTRVFIYALRISGSGAGPEIGRQGEKAGLCQSFLFPQRRNMVISKLRIDGQSIWSDYNSSVLLCRPLQWSAFPNRAAQG